jgi:hypothetical protein
MRNEEPRSKKKVTFLSKLTWTGESTALAKRRRLSFAYTAAGRRSVSCSGRSGALRVHEQIADSRRPAKVTFHGHAD